MKKLIFFSVALLLLACSENEPKTLREMKSDKLLSESFSENELENLAKIVDFFESQICLDKSMSKEQCYFEFNKNTIEEYLKEFKGFKTPINYHLQITLYTKIDSSFFKEIWKHPTYYKDRDLKKKIIEESYDLNQFGKYALFLKSLEKNDKLFKDFYKMLSVSNETSFGVQASAFSRFTIEEFEGIKRRIFFAIYYLTINDKMYNYKSRKK